MQYLSVNRAVLASPQLKCSYYFSLRRKERTRNFCAANSSSIRSNDVIVVGAGVAGSSLAHTLGKDGRRVHLIERNLNQPDTFSGELLQPAGYLKLLELGLDDCLRGIDAQVVLGFAIYKDGKGIKLPYPLENYENDVAGRSFRHGRFVQKMRAKAASLPNVELEQGTATALIEEGMTIKGIKYKTSNGRQLTTYAPLTIVCDGRFSSFRKFLAEPKVDKLAHVVGLVVENSRLPHSSYAHLVVGNPWSFVSYPISSTETRFLIDFSGPNLPPISNGQMAHFLKTVIAPMVPPGMCKAFISSVDKGEIRTMPITCMPAAPQHTPGAVLLGDALNMRHALSGGGMTVALHDVALLCNLFRDLDLEDTAKVTKYTRHFYSMRKVTEALARITPMAFTLNVLADTSSKMIYATPDELREEVLQGYFNYLTLEPWFIGGPVGLMSGLKPEPWRLFIHLCIGATCVAGTTVSQVPTPDRVSALARLASSAASTVVSAMFGDGLESGQILFPEIPPSYNIGRRTVQNKSRTGNFRL